MKNPGDSGEMTTGGGDPPCICGVTLPSHILEWGGEPLNTEAEASQSAPPHPLNLLL